MAAGPLFERFCVVFLASSLGCLLLGRQVIRGLVALKWIAPLRYGDCPALKPIQQSKQAVPAMGGLLVLGIAISAAAVFGGLSHLEGWLVLLASVSMGAVGLIDDVLKLKGLNAKGLRCWPKLMISLGVGGVIGLLLADPVSGYRSVDVPWLSHRIELGSMWFPYACLVIAGFAHAANLTDGMDGLAVGCMAVAFAVLGLWVIVDSSQQVTWVWCASLAGACVGFLWFNSFPASVFLGDVGALGLGAALGSLALISHAALGLLIVGGVFVAEAVSVMLQVASYRWRSKRRIFRVAPLHHHFQLGGASEPKLVVRFWIVGLLLAALGLASAR